MGILGTSGMCLDVWSRRCGGFNTGNEKKRSFLVKKYFPIELGEVIISPFLTGHDMSTTNVIWS
jgi:hypothetical protein